MAKISSVRVPKAGIPVLLRVAELDGEHAGALVARLSDGHFRSLATLIATVKEAVGEKWDEDEADAFVTHLLSMVALRTSHDFEADELAGHLVSQIGADKLDDAARKVLVERLTGLLGAAGFAAFGKAFDIAQESDRLLHVSRVITDLRPVFPDKASSEPVGAVILHTLRLDYFERGETKAFSLLLNSRDLTQLKRTVDRALEKEATLSRLLGRVELPEFDLSGDTDE